jgi:hypothetical protein
LLIYSYRGLVTSVVRFAYFYKTIHDGNPDFTYNNVKLGCVCIAESGSYLTAACLPTYRTFFRKRREQTTVTGGNSNGNAGELVSLNTRRNKVFGSGNGFSLLGNEGTASISREDSNPNSVC